MLCSIRYSNIVTLIISIIIIFLEGKSDVQKDIQRYFFYKGVVNYSLQWEINLFLLHMWYFILINLVFVCLMTVTCSQSCSQSSDCNSMHCKFGSHCVIHHHHQSGNCECAGNSFHVIICCAQTDMNYLQY